LANSPQEAAQAQHLIHVNDAPSRVGIVHERYLPAGKRRAMKADAHPIRNRIAVWPESLSMANRRVVANLISLIRSLDEYAFVPSLEVFGAGECENDQGLDGSEAGFAPRSA
jgi:hypothetical protein